MSAREATSRDDQAKRLYPPLGLIPKVISLNLFLDHSKEDLGIANPMLRMLRGQLMQHLFD